MVKVGRVNIGKLESSVFIKTVQLYLGKEKQNQPEIIIKTIKNLFVLHEYLFSVLVANLMKVLLENTMQLCQKFVLESCQGKWAIVVQIIFKIIRSHIFPYNGGLSQQKKSKNNTTDLAVKN